MNEIKNHKSDGKKAFGKMRKKCISLIDESENSISEIKQQ
jgi:hypothetical protein